MGTVRWAVYPRFLLVCLIWQGCTSGKVGTPWDSAVEGGSATLDGPGSRDGPPADQPTVADLASPDTVAADLAQAPDTVPPPPCVASADKDTLLLYAFSGSGATVTVTDATGKHPGTIVETGPARVSGKSGCGKAMSFSDTTPISYVETKDSPDWDLAHGSVDFWVRFDTSGTNEGVFSRDASGTTNPGHISVLRLCTGALYLRLQRSATEEYTRCTSPLAKETWYAVGVNFGQGGLELWVNGNKATSTTTITCGTDTYPCGGATDAGIDGNDNPWILGTLAWTSEEGKATPVKNPLSGRIDSFRVSKTRRSYLNFK